MNLRNKKIVIMSAIVCTFVIALGMIIVNSLVNHNLQNIAFEISFPKEMDATVTTATKKIYNVNSLQEMVDEESAYIYYKPKLTDYSIASKLKFNLSEYSVYDDCTGIRLYLSPAGKTNKRLEIDQYGCFTYSSAAEDTWFEFPFNDEKTLEIAKTFLNQYNLLDDSFTIYVISNTEILSADSSKIVARKVEFFQSLDDKEICGNHRIGVEINGNGEITDVYYYVRKYEKRQVVELISVEEALQRIDQNKAYIDVRLSSLAEKIIFEKVSVAYWTQNHDYDHTVMQPVYVFQGIFQDSFGESEKFTITVQANAYE